MTTLTLNPGEQRTIDAAGQFVFIEDGSAGLYVGAMFPTDAGHELAGSESGIVLDPRDQARWNHRFTGLRLINQGAAAQTVTLKISDAQFFPKQDGGAVTIAGQTIPVEVTMDPLDPPAVTVNGGISLDGPVEVEPAPAAAAFPVSLDAQTVVVQTEENAPDGLVSGGAVTPTAGGQTIPANLDRISITLRCDSANDGGPVMVAGVPLYAGDPPLTIWTTAAVTVVGGDADDVIYYFETERS